MSERVLPASHPVLRRYALPPVSAIEIASYSDRLDSIAMAVAQLPDQPLTATQIARLEIIARELMRRSQ